MSFSLVLNIDVSQLQNIHKGKFFAEVKQLLSDQDFDPFRTAVSEGADVYNANEKEYGKIMIMSKITSILMKYNGRFSIYKVNNGTSEEISVKGLETILGEFKAAHNLPHFRYNPNVYENGVVSFYNDVCEVCRQESDYFVEGCYGERDLEVICINCVASGRAAVEQDVYFNTHYPQTFRDDDRFEELTKRTPHFFSWQEVPWAEHCQDYCAYIKKVKWNDIKHLEIELMEDLLYIANSYNYEIEDIKKYLNGYMDGHLFQCLHCGSHKLITDLP